MNTYNHKRIIIATSLIVAFYNMEPLAYDDLDKNDNKVINNLISEYADDMDDIEDNHVTISRGVKKVKPVELINKEDQSKGNKKAKEILVKSDLAGVDLVIEPNENKADIGQLIQDAYEAFNMGHYEVALTFYEQAHKLDPKNDEILFGVAVVHHKLGQFEQAKQYYVQILEAHPSNKLALNNFLAIVSLEKPDAALNALRRLEAAEPTTGAIPAQIASIYQRQGKEEIAIKYYKKANKLEPNNLDYVYNIGFLYEKLGQKNNAMIIYNKIIQALNSGYKANVGFHEVRSRINNLSSEKVQ
ncbi:MAG: tetratricopeptide repeat protein [Sphingobacteriia bacterium]|nr:tetratricopeptide repeat protein [Sphingobacteriia bacterium]